MTRRRKADDPDLRAHVERLRRAGQPVDRVAIGHLFGVGVATVQTVRSEIDQALQVELAATANEPANAQQPTADGQQSASPVEPAASARESASEVQPAATAGKPANVEVLKPKRAEGGRTVQDFDGRQLVHWRRQRLLMQDELAVKAGISRGEIGHLERRRRKPTLRTLRKLSEALQVDASELLEEQDDVSETRATG
jgi:DNA-binding XRE family transcriptional regulator